MYQKLITSSFFLLDHNSNDITANFSCLDVILYLHRCSRSSPPRTLTPLGVAASTPCRRASGGRTASCSGPRQDTAASLLLLHARRYWKKLLQRQAAARARPIRALALLYGLSPCPRRVGSLSSPSLCLRTSSLLNHSSKADFLIKAR